MPDVFTVFLNKDDDDDSLGERGGGGRGGALSLRILAVGGVVCFFSQVPTCFRPKYEIFFCLFHDLILTNFPFLEPNWQNGTNQNPKRHTLTKKTVPF